MPGKSLASIAGSVIDDWIVWLLHHLASMVSISGVDLPSPVSADFASQLRVTDCSIQVSLGFGVTMFLLLTVVFCRSLAKGLFVFHSCFLFKSALLVHYSFGSFEGETFESYVLELFITLSAIFCGEFYAGCPGERLVLSSCEGKIDSCTTRPI